MRKNVYGLVLCALLYALSIPVHAQSDFFQGKSVRVVRGGQPGDLYDLWTRHIATYLGKHIPGNPSVTVQNMPGAGSVIAANYVYNVAKPDGLTLGSLNSAIYMDQLIGRKEVQFDWAKFNWIGTPEPTELLFIIRGDSPYKTIDDFRKGGEPPKCGSTGTASITSPGHADVLRTDGSIQVARRRSAFGYLDHGIERVRPALDSAAEHARG
jgi:tripartite-type tricarboxylate transporter receptor subunit TctC